MENDTIESVFVRAARLQDELEHVFCSMQEAFVSLPDSNDPGEGQQDTAKDERT